MRVAWLSFLEAQIVHPFAPILVLDHNRDANPIAALVESLDLCLICLEDLQHQLVISNLVFCCVMRVS
jgi:hypothetical protein